MKNIPHKLLFKIIYFIVVFILETLVICYAINNGYFVDNEVIDSNYNENINNFFVDLFGKGLSDSQREITSTLKLNYKIKIKIITTVVNSRVNTDVDDTTSFSSNDLPLFVVANNNAESSSGSSVISEQTVEGITEE